MSVGPGFPYASATSVGIALVLPDHTRRSSGFSSAAYFTRPRAHAAGTKLGGKHTRPCSIFARSARVFRRAPRRSSFRRVARSSALNARFRCSGSTPRPSSSTCAAVSARARSFPAAAAVAPAGSALVAASVRCLARISPVSRNPGCPHSRRVPGLGQVRRARAFRNQPPPTRRSRRDGNRSASVSISALAHARLRFPPRGAGARACRRSPAGTPEAHQVLLEPRSLRLMTASRAASASFSACARGSHQLRCATKVCRRFSISRVAGWTCSSTSACAALDVPDASREAAVAVGGEHDSSRRRAPVRHGGRGSADASNPGSMPKGAFNAPRRADPDRTRPRARGVRVPRDDAAARRSTCGRGTERGNGRVDRAAVECVGAWDDEKSITNERSARTFRSFANFDVPGVGPTGLSASRPRRKAFRG